MTDATNPHVVTVMAVGDGDEVKWRRSRDGQHPRYRVEMDGSVKDVPVLAAIHMLADGLIALPDGITLPAIAEAIESAPSDHLSDFLRAHGKQDMWWDAHTHFFSAKLRGSEELTEKDRTDIADILDSFHQQLHPSGRGGRIVVLTDDEKRAACRDLHASAAAK